MLGSYVSLHWFEAWGLASRVGHAGITIRDTSANDAFPEQNRLGLGLPVLRT